MSPVPEPVLVLDGQTIQALACVRSLGRAGHPVFVASNRRQATAAWSRFCRARVRSSGETPEAFAALREWASARGVRVVLPLTERACLLCNLDRTAWESAGITVGCAPHELLVQAFDKARTVQAARACGVDTPPTEMPGSLEEARRSARSLGFPCVVKSRFSHAWTGDGFVSDPGPAYVETMDALDTAVLARRQGMQWPIVQGFVPGRGKGVFALFDHGRPVAWFAHERLRDVRPSGSGSSLRRSTELEDRLRQPAERLLTHLAWHGPAMAEFRDDGQSAPRLIEINGRFWGSLGLTIAAGADFPNWWVALLLGRALPDQRNYERGVIRRWFWGDVKRFLYILAGRPRGYPGAYPTRWQGVRELLGPQPPGTRSETWIAGDRWPGIGEWVQGLVELGSQTLARRARPRTDPAKSATQDVSWELPPHADEASRTAR